MRKRNYLLPGATLAALGLVLTSRDIAAEPRTSPLVRIAEIEIDPATLELYKAALKEEIETSIQVEPGVLTLYAVP